MLTHALVQTLTRRGRHQRDRRIELRWGNNYISLTQLGSAGLEPWMPAYAVRLPKRHVPLSIGPLCPIETIIKDSL